MSDENSFCVISILEFETTELANKWSNSEDYQKLIPLRHAATSDSWLTITNQFVMPS
ncbi:MAG: DUF1330 domain-containing protein [Candidatus Kariarchaeaceae archaeon]